MDVGNRTSEPADAAAEVEVVAAAVVVVAVDDDGGGAELGDHFGQVLVEEPAVDLWHPRMPWRKDCT